MAKAYCLTIQVKSAHIENGLGYMVAFRLPPGSENPDEHPDFKAWAEEVREAVLGTGDSPFSADPYTKKLALTQLMHDLAELNAKYSIRIDGLDGMPAVQIHSTNPYDSEIDLDFTGVDGHFSIVEKNIHGHMLNRVSDHGKTGVIEGNSKHFPFEKESRPAAPRPPQGFRPPSP